ncbi:MAG: hypothetical protein ABW092_19640 [Candidatus Thiodiazotropha sp.]
MKNNKLSLSLMVAAALMLVACNGNAESPSQNPSQQQKIQSTKTISLPLKNPSFEASDQYLEGWGFSQHAGKPSYLVSVDTSESTDGKNSYRIERKLVQSWGMVYQWLPLEDASGKSITLSAMIKSENLGPDGFDISLVFRKANRRFISEIGSEVVTGTNQWQRITATGVVPDNTAQLQITAVLNDAGTAWLDDVRVSISDEN